MTRFAAERRVFYVEEPVFAASGPPYADGIARTQCAGGHSGSCSPGSGRKHGSAIENLLNDFFAEQNMQSFAAWYYSPDVPGAHAPSCRQSPPSTTVWMSCLRSKTLLSLWVSWSRSFSVWRTLCLPVALACSRPSAISIPSVYAFPVQRRHQSFAQARRQVSEPQDQRDIPHPRIGFLVSSMNAWIST